MKMNKKELAKKAQTGDEEAIGMLILISDGDEMGEMSPEQRRQMRERMANMTEEQRAAMRERMEERRQAGPDGEQQSDHTDH